MQEEVEVPIIPIRSEVAVRRCNMRVRIMNVSRYSRPPRLSNTTYSALTATLQSSVIPFFGPQSHSPKFMTRGTAQPTHQLWDDHYHRPYTFSRDHRLHFSPKQGYVLTGTNFYTIHSLPQPSILPCQALRSESVIRL
jgi:hypothetical protein